MTLSGIIVLLVLGALAGYLIYSIIAREGYPGGLWAALLVGVAGAFFGNYFFGFWALLFWEKP